jgi:hypothetical protein
MRRSDPTGPRLVAVFLLGGVLLNWPILAIFTRPGRVAGIPLLPGYAFGAWILLIGLMAWIIESRRG